MSEKYIVGMGNHIGLNDNGMMQGYTYVLWSDNTWEMLHSETWPIGNPTPL